MISEPNLQTGRAVTPEELALHGFMRLELQFHATDVSVPFCEWDTLGDVPEGPGLYAFVIVDPRRSSELRVTYVGRTKHLWMVTKGRLPRGEGARGPQRYGRYKHAGETRQRINRAVARARQQGYDAYHWVSPRAQDGAQLALAEEELIRLWRLRKTGWNIG